MHKTLDPAPEKFLNDGAIKMYMIQPGILVTECVSDVHIDMTLALELHRFGNELCDFTSVPHLVLAKPGLSASKEVREWGASEKANEYNLATAIVTKTLSIKMIGNFFIKVQNPPRPTKMFTSKETAIDWLSEFID